ncbi:magnesium transporter [Azotobacter sp. CWF10]
MNRHYYVSDDLDDLERVEQELEAKGIDAEQIHVLSEQDAELERHERLHGVPSMMKTDVVRSGTRGVFIGLLLAALVLIVAYFSDWTNTVFGWVPFIFLAIVLFGFSIWEGGFLGFQKGNRYFRPLQDKLHQGKHVFFVDVEPAQEPLLEQVIRRHPKLEVAGTGTAMPQWIMNGEKKWHRFKSKL